VGVDHQKFSIDRNNGVIRTTASFDREAKNEYYVTVVAEDGAPSDRPNHYPPGTPNQGWFARSCTTTKIKITKLDYCIILVYLLS